MPAPKEQGRPNTQAGTPKITINRHTLPGSSQHGPATRTLHGRSHINVANHRHHDHLAKQETRGGQARDTHVKVTGVYRAGAPRGQTRGSHQSEKKSLKFVFLGDKISCFL
jgi:hypothetical protein